MRKKFFLPLIICLGIAQSISAIQSNNLSANDFIGDLHMEMEIKLPTWFISIAQSLNGAGVKVGTAAIPHVGQIPFIPDLTSGLTTSITGLILREITLPLYIDLKDIRIRQYKNGLFTFKLEHILSVLDDQLDLRIQMPFIGCFLKDKAILKCMGTKIHFYLGDVLHIKNPVLKEKEQSSSILTPVKNNGWIIASHVPGVIGKNTPTQFSVKTKIKINRLGSLPLKFPSLFTLKINLNHWTLSKITRLTKEKTSLETVNDNQ